MKNSRPNVIPNSAENLISFFAGPQLDQAILGDLEERVSNQSHSRLWLWKETLLSLPSLLLLNLGNLKKKSWLESILFMTMALCMIWLWELKIAQRFSWPLAQHFLSLSPLSAEYTCKACYVTFYGCAFALCYLLVSKKLKNQYRRQVFRVILAMIACIPVIFYLFNPGPYDGSPLFRFFQIGLVWGIFLLFPKGSKLIQSKA